MKHVDARDDRSAFLACAITVLLAGCSGNDESPEPMDRTSDDAKLTDADVGGARKDASARTRDAMAMDANRPRPATQASCTPGQYEGQFSCLISGLLPWVGKMSFALVEKTAGAGEFTTLQIVPGTRISGNDDSFQGEFTATLEGEFDCQTKQLAGRLVDGNYLLNGFMNFELNGPLEGTYASDGGAPGFGGKMGPLKSANFDLAGDLAPYADCTWNAARVSAAVDAGS